MKFQQLQNKRQFIADKVIIGIDPAKRKHQAAIIDTRGLQIGHPFAFKNNHTGYKKELHEKLQQYVPDIPKEQLVFAIEISCNLWQNISFYLHHSGFKVILVSPLTTYRARPCMNNDFSKTDPKDALIVASNARDGYFSFLRDHCWHSQAMHNLSITYDKLRKDLVKNKQRLRSVMELVFPEFISVIQTDTETARFLLKQYFLPQHYLKIDVETVGADLYKISRHNYDQNLLCRLKQLAQNSIGIPVENELEQSIGMSIHNWIGLIDLIEQQLKSLMKQMIYLAAQTRYFPILTSLKGISNKLAAFFIAETQELENFDHYKKLEKFAGLNLKQTQSGEYRARRHISHLGNGRLTWVIYKMAEETARYVPEVRMKFLRRQIKKQVYRKNIIAASTPLLKLIVAMVRDNKIYQPNSYNINAVHLLEQQYQELKNNKKYKIAS